MDSPQTPTPEVIESLCDIRTVSLRAELRAKRGARLPGWLGSTLHGAIGHALGAESPSAYEALFTPTEPPESTPHHLQAIRTPALCIAPPELRTDATAIEEGGALRFGLVLPAARMPHVDALLGALQRIGAEGLGEKRAPFELSWVDDSAGAIWRGGVTTRTPRPDGRSTAVPQDRCSLLIETLSPLRIHREASLMMRPGLSDIVEASARRLAAFHALYGDGAPSVDLRGVAALADGAIGLLSAWRGFHEERLSTRQDRYVPMDGTFGVTAFADVPAPALTILESAARVGIGKGASMGFGRLRVVRMGPERHG